MKIDDVPAAHSMDTTWFAVDQDGHVGVFDTGEAGGVPNGVAIGFGEMGDAVDTFPLDMLRLTRALASPDAKLDALAKVDVAQANRRVVAVIDPNRAAEPSTYRDERTRSPFEEALGDGLWILRETTPRIVTSRAGLTDAQVAALRGDATVVGVIHEGDLAEWVEVEKDTGVFAFHNEDYEAAGAYMRGPVPHEPIRLDELPRDLADAIAATRLKTSFRKSKELQLADHFSPSEVQTWDPKATLVAPPPMTKQAREEAAFQKLREETRARGDRRMRVMVYGLVAFIALIFFLGIHYGHR